MRYMSLRKVTFWLWFVKWLIPKTVKYFCFINIMSYCTTGKYDKTIVPNLSGMDAIKRYGDDKDI